MVTIQTKRWIQCDRPGCERWFSTAHHRAVIQRTGDTKLTLRKAAALDRWLHTEEGDDLCPDHADVYLNRPPQPALFPVPGADHEV